MVAAGEENAGHDEAKLPDQKPTVTAEEAKSIDPASEVETCTATFTDALGRVLEHLCALGDTNKLTRFDAVRPPQITVHHYVQRLQRYFGCSPECFVLALVYLDRVVKMHPEFSISRLNIHRLLVTAVMVAAKFFDDVYYSNGYYARVGGVRLKEMNLLEVRLLDLLQWRLFVSPTEYQQYMNNVLLAVYGNEAATDAEDAPEPMDVSE
jgi:hypothetical protein